MREWSAEAEVPLRSFAVCSDAKVGKGRGKDSLSEDISVVDLAIPATTDAHALAQRLARPAVPVDGVAPMTVVFATYQSIDVVARAQEAGAPAFDLIICDEAHRTTGATAAGEQDSAFVRVHDSAYLRGAKRLYMTATPRIYDDSTKARAGEKNAVLASMDDETTYGAELFRLGFGEAVSRSLLTDYKVLVLTVSEEQVAAQLQSSLAQDGQLKLDDAARIVGCWNALAKRSAQAGDFGADDRPMRTAVAFARDIATSKRFASSFNGVAEDYRRTLAEPDGGASGLASVEVRHVDGSMNILERTERLSWLAGGAEEATAGDGASSCRVLTNARCLSEGVDVPALDAVMFLSPRKSQVDIVQSVGRVMRLAPGKKYGYIILPVAIPAGKAPEEVLADNDVFRVVWEVLQALRAHDERFDAMVNKIDLNRSKPDKVAIIDPFAPGGDDGDGEPGASPTAQGLQTGFDLDSLGRWKDAIYARLVQKVGSRRYWEQWAKDVAQIAARHRTRLERRVADPAVAGEFETFLAALRANLNDSITEDSAIDMLSQHLVTKPVFDAVFDGYDFGAENPVAQVMSRMLTVLDGDSLEAETQQLEGFYASVRERCAGIDNAEGKQRVITELYEKFFSLAFPATAKSLGIVYTPVEIVDFILRSVDWLSREHFGRGVSDEGVHVLDPFTGTGTFIVRLLQSGLIRPEDLARKYASELHANEILLLAYYIATANIEVAYRDCASGSGDGYAPFNGIVLTDTFQMGEDDDVLDRSVFVANNDRAEAQRGLDIRLIVGNPPYSVGQKSANDNNANQPYPCLDLRIGATYAERAVGKNMRNLYDSYLRAIRWASDRLGDAGVIGFVTNGGFIDANTADGVRLSLAEEFAHIYVFNLRGNQRTAGELSRQEGGKVFGAGSRATVAVTFLVKNPAHTGPAVIHYRDIGDYLSREDKLAIVADSRVEEMDWDRLVPNEVGDWINQRDPRYQSWRVLGSMKGGDPVFSSTTLGVTTNRDVWVYNFSLDTLRDSCERLIDTYNAERERVHRQHRGAQLTDKSVRDLVTTDETQIKWTRDLYGSAAKNRLIRYDAGATHLALYRPFCKQWLNASDGIIYLPAILRRYFPTPAHDNLGFYIVGSGSDVPFSSLVTDVVPNLHVTGAGSGGQFFPRWTWEKVSGRHAAEDQGFDLDALSEPQGEAGAAVGYEGEVIGDYRRVDNVTDATLNAYRAAYGPEVDKADVFYYVYGLLHHPEYRSRYGADLKKSLPRIPLVATREDFTALATAGRALADLHLDYEEVEPWPLTLTVDGASLPWARRTDLDPARLRVTKMRYAKTRVDGTRVDDKTSIVYNEHVTVSGIPEQAQDYLLGSRSALDWLLDRYQVKVDKASGIVNDPNDWMDEGAGAEPGAPAQPLYLLDLIARVTTVSVRTQQIVHDLPALTIRD
ncbi:type ISP restriction/modification enzyme [Actinomyces sp. zg328]|uniref:type ISP restriction/modification enzyme n=1 Tax=Actinomyces sp. zg328 TaxID=2609287 RepID=UPI0022A79C62|nr:type ISP restriction/modification enzyme [Actinomyces sp. zg328]